MDISSNYKKGEQTMKISYKNRLFFYFLLIFLLFSASVILLQRNEERKYRIELLQSQLDNYGLLVHNYLQNRGVKPKDSILKSIKVAEILPEDIRLSIINQSGKVLYDRDFPENVAQMENHLFRPEIESARYKGFGWNIRESSSVHTPFFYVARYYKDYYIRIALEYTDDTRSLLQADNYFLYVVLAIFLAMLLFLYVISTRFGKSVQRLKDFSIAVRNGKNTYDEITFPNDELGDIAKELVLIFKEQEKTNKALESEKEKVIQHLKYAPEGVAIFDKEHKKVYANTHFYQVINLLTETATFNIEDIFKLEEFTPIKEFLGEKDRKEVSKTTQISKNGKHILLRTCLFEDESYEIRLSNITKMEETRILKQQMTSNIAHELRTPTTCLRGFLETLYENPTISAEQRNAFIGKAYKQSQRLTQLIEDISLLSNLAESSERYKYEKVNLKEISDTIQAQFMEALTNNNMIFYGLQESVEVLGNYGLLYSVFSNLVDNAIKYAGKDTSLYIKHLQTKDNQVYISFYDTGVGIEEEHLNRIFERFYRTDKGRTRNAGGSGLGLSIVYNIIQMHQGDIQVKLHQNGGLEYQICLKEFLSN